MDMERGGGNGTGPWTAVPGSPEAVSRGKEEGPQGASAYGVSTKNQESEGTQKGRVRRACTRLTGLGRAGDVEAGGKKW